MQLIAIRMLTNTTKQGQTRQSSIIPQGFICLSVSPQRRSEVNFCADSNFHPPRVQSFITLDLRISTIFLILLKFLASACQLQLQKNSRFKISICSSVFLSELSTFAKKNVRQIFLFLLSSLQFKSYYLLIRCRLFYLGFIFRGRAFLDLYLLLIRVSSLARKQSKITMHFPNHF